MFDSRTPSQRSLFVLFVPLALGGIFFPLARPFLNATLARMPDPVTALAAYSIALSIAMPFLSPLFALRQVTTALAGSSSNLRSIRNLSWLLAGGGTLLLLTVCIPSLYDLIVQKTMGIPPPIADAAHSALVVFAVTPLLAVFRSYYQGTMVAFGRSWPIGLGAFVYLAVIVAVMILVVSATPSEGAFLAALALTSGQVAYLAVVWISGRRFVIDHPERLSPPENPTGVPSVFRFYLPLAVSTLLFSVLEPALQAGIVRVELPEASLAAYPVCVSLIWLAGTPLWNVQQVVIARVNDAASFAAVSRFVLMLSLGLSAAMILLGVPPLVDLVLGRMMGVEGEVFALARSGFIWFSLMPILMGARSLYQGTLIRMRRPNDIQGATVVRIVSLAGFLCAGVLYGNITGLMLAVWSTLFSSAAEIVSLGIRVRRLDLDTCIAS